MKCFIKIFIRVCIYYHELHTIIYRAQIRKILWFEKSRSIATLYLVIEMWSTDEIKKKKKKEVPPEKNIERGNEGTIGIRVSHEQIKRQTFSSVTSGFPWWVSIESSEILGQQSILPLIHQILELAGAYRDSSLRDNVVKNRQGVFTNTSHERGQLSRS